MQATQIESLREFLLGVIPQFDGNGYIIEKGKDDSFKGITDDISFWFYINFQDNIESFEFDNDTSVLPNKGAVEVTGNYKIVAGMCGTNKHNAIDVLVAALRSAPGMIDVQMAWTDAEEIVSNELDGKKLKEDLQLYQVNFQLVTYKTNIINCLTLECGDTTC